MKKTFRLIMAVIAILAVAVAPCAFAADLAYTTLVQDTDSALVAANKAAAVANSNTLLPITTATTTAVKASAGILERIVVGTVGSSSTCTVYDALSATGTPVAVINTDSLGTYHFGGRCATGITIVTVGTPKLTIVYR